MFEVGEKVFDVELYFSIKFTSISYLFPELNRSILYVLISKPIDRNSCNKTLNDSGIPNCGICCPLTIAFKLSFLQIVDHHVALFHVKAVELLKNKVQLLEHAFYHLLNGLILTYKRFQL